MTQLEIQAKFPASYLVEKYLWCLKSVRGLQIVRVDLVLARVGRVAEGVIGNLAGKVVFREYPA